MKPLMGAIIEYTEQLSEGTPVGAKELLHLGTRAAVDQALSRLARSARLLRIGRGLYVRPLATRFGTRAPAVSKVVEALAAKHGETVVPHGAAAANALGLSAQVPVRSVYLTSGPSRRLTLGAQVVSLRHVPRWQLALPGQAAGAAVRAVAWLGPAHAAEALSTLRRKLSRSELGQIAAIRPVLPEWMAQQVSNVLVNA